MFGAVKLVKHADIDKYKYSGYGIGFDMKGTFGFPAIGFARNVIIFEADMDSSVHIDNKNKKHSNCGKGSTQGLDGTTVTVEKMFSINFIEHNKKFLFKLVL